jgi:exosortase/archaeosortase family protein
LSNFWLERMQLWTAQFSGWILSAVGQTVLVTGDQILRGGQRFAIIETCSGVRITETLSMLAILMLNLFRRTPLHAAVVLAVTPPVAFLCNSLRAVTLILNPYADIGEIHTAQGIGMMLGGLLVLYAIDGLVGRLIPPGRPAPAPAAPATAAPVSVLRMGIGMAVLAVAALLSRTVTPWEPWNLILSGPHLETLSDVPGWTSKPLEVDYRFLGRLGIQDDLYRRYYQGGETVELYIGVGASQVRPRSPLFGKADLPGSGWHIEERSVSDQIPEGGGGAVLLGSTLTRRFVVVSWHENAQGLVSEALRSFFATDRNRWRRRGQGLVVRLGTPVAGLGAPAREAAAARLLRFYGDLRPRLATLNRALEVPE